MHKFILIFAILLASTAISAAYTPAFAAGGDMDDILGGFDDGANKPTAPDLDTDILDGFADVAIPESPPRAPAKMPPWLQLNGGLSLSSSYNFAHDPPPAGQTDHRGFSRLRSALDLDADITLAKGWKGQVGGKAFYDSIYAIRGRANYTDEVLDKYEDEVELTEVYLQGSLRPNLDLKSGRQIVVWGKSDNIRVTDILNPLDNREPGVVDIRDLRLPVTMTKLDFYNNSWNLSAIIIHENRFNKDPVYGNDFYPAPSPPPPKEKPSTAINNQEYALAVNGIFSGWDLSFYAAELFDDQAHRETSIGGPILKHSRINMLGSAINIAQGNWLLKGEAAYLTGQEYSIAVGRKNRLDILLGTEYTGISETVLSIELVNRHIFNFDDRLKQAPVYGQEDEFQYVFRVNRDFHNDILQVTGLFSTFGLSGDDGALQRLSAEYDWSDSTAITLGAIFYQHGDKLAFQNIAANDRLFMEIRYSF